MVLYYKAQLACNANQGSKACSTNELWQNIDPTDFAKISACGTAERQYGKPACAELGGIKNKFVHVLFFANAYFPVT